MDEKKSGFDSKTLIGIAVLLVVIALVALTDVSQMNGEPSDGKVSLGIGESKTAEGVTIGVLELVEDSRCPVDVQCIQAGTVRVRVAINAMNRDFVFTVNEPQTVVDTTITLIDVEPRMKYAMRQVELDDYHFTFAISSSTATTTNNSL